MIKSRLPRVPALTGLVAALSVLSTIPTTARAEVPPQRREVRVPLPAAVVQPREAPLRA